MTPTFTSSAARTVAVLLALVLVLGLSPLGAHAAAATEAEAQSPTAEAEEGFASAVNASRDAEGLGPLAVNAPLAEIARAWSGEMDAADRMSHNPHYAAQYPGGWTRMGENVGYATWPGAPVSQVVSHLHQAFMDSPGHRANILGDYNQVGVGVVIDGDTVWVTVNFLQGPLLEVEDETATYLPDVLVVPQIPIPAPPVRSHYVRG